MYAAHAAHFKDPFAINQSDCYAPSEDWQTRTGIFHFNGPLTPPLEMNAGPRTSRPAYYQQEHEHRSSSYPSQQQQPYQAPAAAQPPQDLNSHAYHSNGGHSRTNSRTISPVRQSYQDAQTVSHSRRVSQANAIAPSFQIPSTVNSSGGSLSELAAQITCLFWFESSDLLRQIENSSVPVQLSRHLVLDTKPTTGFRKWVTTILSTTLVAQNVVLLALLFIYRLKKLNPSVKGKPGSEYRLLTVALMLGNKFLDDNTYTNKTWAEVSGILVTEVHIMEVEFLSNMKYCLFTSAKDWTQWQSLLGKFAAFLEQASKPQPSNQQPRILTLASSLYPPVALPSPPASNQASPPYSAELVHNGSSYQPVGYHGFTPAPSPLAAMSTTNDENALASRKRTYEESLTEPPPKRLATSFQQYDAPNQHTGAATRRNDTQQMARMPQPDMTAPKSQTSSGYHVSSRTHLQQLPPLDVTGRAMSMVYPNASSQVQIPQISSLLEQSAQSQSQRQSPYPGSAATTPAHGGMPSAGPLRSATNVSPTYFLQQRSSPYKPVHNVSTLTHPPSSSALQYRPQSVEYDQMRYQPLGQPIEHRRTGQLPYVAQNVWLDGNHHKAMTPVDQWPSFANSQQQRHLLN